MGVTEQNPQINHSLKQCLTELLSLNNADGGLKIAPGLLETVRACLC